MNSYTTSSHNNNIYSVSIQIYTLIENLKKY